MKKSLAFIPRNSFLAAAPYNTLELMRPLPPPDLAPIVLFPFFFFYLLIVVLCFYNTKQKPQGFTFSTSWGQRVPMSRICPEYVHKKAEELPSPSAPN